MTRALLTLTSEAVRPDQATKTCAWCGTSFTKDHRYSSRYFSKQKFCSQACFGSEQKHKADISRVDERAAFARNVGPENHRGCTEWLGARDKDGYGAFGYAGVMHRAHRASLRLSGTPVPKGKMVCHRCDNPACVNPQHLYVGTGVENMRDAKERNRLRVGSRNHFAKLDESTVRAIRTSREPVGQLAAKYGVSHGAISMILSRKTWKHI